MTIRELLTGNEGAFIFESYQRPYIWGRTHRDRPDSPSLLFDGFTAAMAAGDDYMLHSITVAVADDGLEVVDGQQRIVFLFLLLRMLGCNVRFNISYPYRPSTQKLLDDVSDGTLKLSDLTEPGLDHGIDIYHIYLSVLIIKRKLAECDFDHTAFADNILDHVYITPIVLPQREGAETVFKMLAGAKAEISATDVIKSSMMMLEPSGLPVSDPPGPDAREWDAMVNWWSRTDVRDYYRLSDSEPLSLLIRLAIPEADIHNHVSYYEFLQLNPDTEAKQAFYHRLRTIHRRIVDAYANADTYNRVRAILLLQSTDNGLVFLKSYFRDGSIDAEALEIYYKLSFLGMSTKRIALGESPDQAFSELLATLSMPDVYNTEARREVYNLLLRLNIDEDIKLDRKFDFSIWNNRSIEHIYSKSKVWHIGSDGHLRDGNESILRRTAQALRRDGSYLFREDITNADGAVLSEHCIGNLVLLYGQNNARFGNAAFNDKKRMFLAPGDPTVFRSRNLLHSVCVFANAEWGSRQIVENYNQTLKNLKLYYGYK